MALLALVLVVLAAVSEAVATAIGFGWITSLYGAAWAYLGLFLFFVAAVVSGWPAVRRIP